MTRIRKRCCRTVVIASIVLPAAFLAAACGSTSAGDSTGAVPTDRAVGGAAPTPAVTTESHTPAPTPPPTILATPVASPPPAPAAQVTTVTSVTSPVTPGSNATLVARTSSNAACTITVTYNSGPSKAAGLGPKTADGSGDVTWTWKVGAKTAPGTYSINVDCNPGGSAQASFTVS